MLPKKFRLSHERIQSIFITSRNVSFGCVRFYYKRSDTDIPGFAFFVSKKAAKKAFERNRIKRLFRAATAQTLKDSPTYLQGVFFVTRTPEQIDIDYFKEHVQQCFRLAGV